ncbi:unnamed protein product [Withania somnifera]
MKNAKIPKFKSLKEANLLLWPPKFSSLSLSLQNYINSDTPIHGQKIHSYILKSGYKPNTNISIKLLILYLKSSCLLYARQMFDELRQPTLSAYNYMISGYVKHGVVLECFNMVRMLFFWGETPDMFTLSMILKGSTTSNGELYFGYVGKQVHARMFKCIVEGDDVLYTALVDSYVKSGRVDYARRVFDLMLERNVVCATSLITGYMNQGYVEEAEDVFSKTVEKDIVVFNAMIEGYSKKIENAKKAIEVYINMQRLGFRSNISTFASIIGACSALAAFEIGQQVQGQMMKTELIEHVKIGSALIDMYSKCGLVDDARRVFNQMPEKNVFSWTSMIDGYGKNGYPNEALELFSIMQVDHFIIPNYVTFLSALSACAHSGLVDKGREIFESMERDYYMKPRMEHYACMVDILGRSGSLNQALEFVINMTGRPDSDVWAALLSSCRLHGDVELANLAANELFKLSCGSRPGAYVALSNVLADAGRWDGVSELREIMKIRGISKGTGFSWVGSDGSLKPFLAGQQA